MAILRTALIGLKGMGRQHLKGLSTSPRAELTAVADIDRESVQAVATEYHIQAHTDYRELLAKESLDAIVFAPPHHLPAPMALAASTC